MFEQNIEKNVEPPQNNKINEISNNRYKNIIYSHTTSSQFEENSYKNIDQLLEREKLQNSNENWNKLDKTIKILKLHQYAEKYGKENALPFKDIKALKTFFIQCMDKNKLQKTKEVIYDKTTKEITGIPSLHYSSQNHNFTLRNMDSKRVSTIKSLTPKRITERNNSLMSMEDVPQQNSDTKENNK